MASQCRQHQPFTVRPPSTVGTEAGNGVIARSSCWRVMDANGLVGFGQLRQNTSVVRFLGDASSADECWSRCNFSGEACRRWVWHRPSFGGMTKKSSWANTCYMIRGHRFLSIMVPDKSVISGYLWKPPSWGEYGFHTKRYSFHLRQRRQLGAPLVPVVTNSTTWSWLHARPDMVLTPENGGSSCVPACAVRYLYGDRSTTGTQYSTVKSVGGKRRT